MTPFPLSAFCAYSQGKIHATYISMDIICDLTPTWAATATAAARPSCLVNFPTRPLHCAASTHSLSHKIAVLMGLFWTVFMQKVKCLPVIWKDIKAET